MYHISCVIGHLTHYKLHPTISKVSVADLIQSGPLVFRCKVPFWDFFLGGLSLSLSHKAQNMVATSDYRGSQYTVLSKTKDITGKH
jgi:hypothetical protein